MKVPNFNTLMKIELPQIVHTVEDEYKHQIIVLEMNDGTVGQYCYEEGDMEKLKSLDDVNGFDNFFEKDDDLTQAVKLKFPDLKQAYYAEL